MQHHEYGPSAHHRLLRCPAALRMGKRYRDPASGAALEGTAAHQLAEVCLRDSIRADDWVPDNVVLMFDPEYADFEQDVLDDPAIDIRRFEKHTIVYYPISASMRWGVNVYLDHVRSLEGDGYAEETVYFSRWVPSSLDEDLTGSSCGFGTTDHLTFFTKPNGKTRCTLTDFKFGRVFVEVENNYQLLGYAAAVIETFGWLYDIDEFVLEIVQPRQNYIGAWSISAADVLKTRRRCCCPPGGGQYHQRPSMCRGQSSASTAPRSASAGRQPSTCSN